MFSRQNTEGRAGFQVADQPQITGQARKIEGKTSCMMHAAPLSKLHEALVIFTFTNI
jgi:hypothetical protein